MLHTPGRIQAPVLSLCAGALWETHVKWNFVTGCLYTQEQEVESSSAWESTARRLELSFFHAVIRLDTQGSTYFTFQ